MKTHLHWSERSKAFQKLWWTKWTPFELLQAPSESRRGADTSKLHKIFCVFDSEPVNGRWQISWDGGGPAMEGFIFLITRTVVIKDSELFLCEDGSILVGICCHADTRMAPLTEMATLLLFTGSNHHSGQPKHHGLVQNFSEALPLKRALSALHTPRGGWDTSQAAECKPAPTFQLFLHTQGSWQVH